LSLRQFFAWFGAAGAPKSFHKQTTPLRRLAILIGQKATNAWGSENYEKAKSVIAFIFLVVLCVSVASVEYDLVMRFGVLFNLSVSVFALFVLLGALLRAPEGYEDENGFHIGALADGAAL
jgi:hypothetical protein